jgi:hypothetical protein
MDSLITRDKNNKIIKIGKFKTYSCDRENLLFGWLYNENDFSEAQLYVLNKLYDEMKEHFLIVNLDN